MPDAHSSSPSRSRAVMPERAGPLQTRRSFLMRGATAAGAALLIPGWLASLAACSDSTSPDESQVLDLGTEPGVLNYCYALAQLEADFYVRVNANHFPGLLASEATKFSSYSSATASARDSLIAAQKVGRISDVLLFRFGDIVNFSDRQSTLTTAQTIADATAGAYTGAIGYLSTPATIASVTALANSATQRSVAIRAMLGLPPATVVALSPTDVMATLAPYYLTTLTLENV